MHTIYVKFKNQIIEQCMSFLLKNIKHVYISINMPYDIKNGSFWVVGLQEIFIYVCVSVNKYVFLYSEKNIKEIVEKNFN